MPEQLEPASVVSLDETPSVDDRMRHIPGLAPLLAEAESTWRARAAAAGLEAEADSGRPGWRTFEDAFPTFYEFTNRPR